MHDREAGAAPRSQETGSGQGKRVFLLAGDDPLPDGVEEGDEGVFVIRLVAPTPAEMEVPNDAY